MKKSAKREKKPGAHKNEKNLSGKGFSRKNENFLSRKGFSCFFEKILSREGFSHFHVLLQNQEFTLSQAYFSKLQNKLNTIFRLQLWHMLPLQERKLQFIQQSTGLELCLMQSRKFVNTFGSTLISRGTLEWLFGTEAYLLAIYPRLTMQQFDKQSRLHVQAFVCA